MEEEAPIPGSLRVLGESSLSREQISLWAIRYHVLRKLQL